MNGDEIRKSRSRGWHSNNHRRHPMSPIRECFCRPDNLPKMQGHTLCGNIVPKMWRRRKDNGAAIHPTDDTRAVRHHYATNSIVNLHTIKLLNSLKKVLRGDLVEVFPISTLFVPSTVHMLLISPLPF